MKFKFMSSIACGLLLSASAWGQADPDGEMAMLKFDALFGKVLNHYVDSVESEALVEDAIRGMLEKLDPHSIYIPAKELAEMNAPLKGNFDGIGVRFNILRDTINVVSPIPGGPSESLGILAGDQIIEVDGEVVAGVGITNSGVGKVLKGKRGTKVNVGIKRRNKAELLKFEITRDKIPIHSIDASYMATPKIGYVKLNRFSATSLTEFKSSLATLKGEGMEDLILDLRGNGGGYLRTAINLADEFLSDKKLIVYTEGRSYPKDEYRSRKVGGFEKGKLVVLIDEGSASASEILSGAIQDWDRGLVLGRRSFGKGLVQKPFALPDGSAVRLTISRYYTPSGRSIQKPYDKGSDAYRAEKLERFKSGEVYSADSIDFPDSLRYETQNKRTVYGGGGIMPDIYVPVDTSGRSPYFDQLLRKGIFSSFSLDYVNTHRDELKKNYPAFKDYKKNFKVDNKLIAKLEAYAEKEGLEKDKQGYADAKFLIDTRLKAQIAANAWDFSRFYEIINVLNNSYLKAIEVLEDDTFKKMKLASNG